MMVPTSVDHSNHSGIGSVTWRQTALRWLLLSRVIVTLGRKERRDQSPVPTAGKVCRISKGKALTVASR
jgi:hypothetical protein